ncbi:hypothetical protein OH77DRAFT_1424178 [Trametes cingulata]|nr:hypothetical protein OH77DRAFT_1424178 [Trametes cingulata]
MLVFSLIPFLMAVPVTVQACEGDCIVGITNAFLGNYTGPVHAVLTSIAHQISDLIPSHPDIDTTFGYLQPILSTYQKQAYNGMETAIFPSYFHGKCLDSQGNEPDGCPNPDCPIVCGTPGSLVHFYPKLRFIAYNQTYHLLQDLSAPGTDTYKRVEQAVMDAAASSPGDRRRGYSRIYPRGLTDAVNVAHNNKVSGSAAHPGSGSGPRSGSGSSLDSVPSSRPQGVSEASPSKMLVPVFLKRAQDVQAGLKSIMAQVHGLLGDACGANGVEDTNGLPECSWETEMKEYILSFP